MASTRRSQRTSRVGAVKRSLNDENQEVKSPAKRVKVEPGVKKVEEDENENPVLLTYEELRERNIRQRQELFNKMGFDQIKQEISSATEDPAKKKTPSRRGLVVKKEAEIYEPRKSLRLQRIDADTGIQLPEKEPTAYSFAPVDDNPRPPVADLSLEDIVSNAEKGVELDQKKAFLSAAAASVEDAKLEYNGKFSFRGEDVSKQLKNLRLPPENVAKVVPNRIFSLAVHPTTEKVLVAAGGKWGNVGLWDVNGTDLINNGVQLFKYHSRPVNCMTFNPHAPSELWSSSYDGTVRCFDLERQMTRVLYGDPEDEDAYVTYHSQLDASTFLITMGTTGRVGVMDTRVPDTSKPSKVMQVFERTSPKTVSAHPQKRDLFVCPNNKGECKLFDMRAAKAKKVMDEVQSYKGHTKALSSAMISPVTGASMVTVSYDNKVRIFETESGKLVRSVSHNNQTGRWLTTFKAEWHPLRDDLFFVGSMNRPRQIDAFTNTGEVLPAIQAEELASVCSIVKCHPTQNIVVGGNSSGRVHVLI